MVSKIDRFESYPISSDADVKVTRMGHLVEIQYMKTENSSCPIRVLDKDTYVVIATGEVCEFAHSDNRTDLFSSLRRSFKHLRYLINNNFTGAPNELFVTLTYSENMQDSKRLMIDFQKFFQRFRYRFKAYGSIDYLSVVEPQERGAWHCHVLMRFNDLNKIFIPNDELAKLWGHGFVVVKSLKGVDNIGAYLSAYLTDLEVTPENFLQSVGKTLNIASNGKSYVKGARLKYYPPKMNLYRHSKGIREPDRVRMKYDKIKSVVGSAKPNYTRAYSVSDLDTGFENIIIYEQYNLKRIE